MRTEEEAQKIRQNYRMEEKAVQQFIESLNKIKREKLMRFVRGIDKTRLSKSRKQDKHQSYSP